MDLAVHTLLALKLAVRDPEPVRDRPGVRYSAMPGQIAIRVIGRRFGLLLAAIAVECVLRGARAALSDVSG